MNMKNLNTLLRTKLEVIKTEHRISGKKQGLIHWDYLVTVREFEALLSKLDEQYANNDTELALADINPFIDFIKSRDARTANTPADPDINTQSNAYKLCIAIAESLPEELHLNPIALANPRLNSDKIGESGLKKLARMMRHEWVTDDDGNYIDVSRAARNACAYAGVMETTMAMPRRPLSKRENNIVLNHSEIVNALITAVQEKAATRRIETLKGQLTVSITSAAYKVTASYGEVGEARLQQALAKNHGLLILTFKELETWLEHHQPKPTRAAFLAQFSPEERSKLFTDRDQVVSCLLALPKEHWRMFLDGFTKETFNKLFLPNGSVDSAIAAAAISNEAETARAQIACLTAAYMLNDAPEREKKAVEERTAEATETKPEDKPTDVATPSTGGMFGFAKEDKRAAAKVFFDFLVSNSSLSTLEEFLKDKNQLRHSPALSDTRLGIRRSTLRTLTDLAFNWKQATPTPIEIEAGGVVTSLGETARPSSPGM